MAANDSGNLYTPPTAGTEPAPVTAETPRRSAFRPIASAPPTAAPAASPAPASSGFQWNPTAAPAASAPVTTAPSAPTAPATKPTPQPVAPKATPASDEHAGAFSVGVDKVKGFAVRAKNSLTEGDDLSASAKRGGPRKARVLVSRIDPWSVLKMGFLLSIAIGIMIVVAVFVLWNALNEFGMFTLINQWVEKLFEGEQPIDITALFELNKVMSAAVLISVMNVILLTALSTIGAFLYNTVSSVVGGVYVTLTDD
jgi:hypothetical protein